MAEIALKNGGVALVDDADLAWLSQWSWSRQKSPTVENRWYAKRCEHRAGRSVTIYMHREIIQPPRDLVCDHINRDGLDNRRENLRPVTTGQNCRIAERRSAASGFRGVKRAGGKWVAYMVERHSREPRGVAYIYLGSFADPVDAARAYDKASRARHGEFGYQNFPGAA